MKKIIGLLAGVLIVIGITGNASAASATFTIDSYTVTCLEEDPGLVLYANDIMSEPYSVVIEEGTSETWDLFTIGTNETYVNWGEDMETYEISVDFQFSLPADLGETVSGTTKGLFIFQSGKVKWEDPVDIAYGDGGLFSIGLSDVCFGTPGSADVSMTVDFKSAAVPVPSTILLLGSGLIGLVGFNRKRK